MKLAARNKLKKRYHLGDCYAALELAMVLIGDCDDKKTPIIIDLLKGAIKAKIYQAAFELGQFYECDWSSKYSPKLAAKWYKLAAAHGVIQSYNQVAVFYEGGIYLPKNLHRAIVFYKKGAAAGDCIAQYNLAQNFEEGKGVSKNLDEAKRWYKASMLQGYDDARKRYKLLTKTE